MLVGNIQDEKERESRAAQGAVSMQLLERAVAEPGPFLLNVRVSPEENVYPMVPAGGAINEMVLGPPKPAPVPL